MKGQEDVKELFQIASSGYDNDGNVYDVYLAGNPVQRQADMPVYKELGHQLGTWTLYGAFFGFLGMLTYAYWGAMCASSCVISAGLATGTRPP